MFPDSTAIFIHDTRLIVAVNDCACALFRCEREALIDLDMLDLVRGDEMKQLARLRMETLHEHGALKFTLDYEFIRCDGSAFCAYTETCAMGGGLYWTQVVKKYEIKRMGW